MSLGKKAAQGILWNALSFGGGKLLTFVSTTILARLIAPEYFGVVALALVATTILDAIGDLGIGAALIHRRDNVERASHVAFTVSIGMGVMLWALATLGAPAFGWYFGDPGVTPLLRVLAFNFIIQSFGNIHSSLLSKNLSFKRKMIPELTRTVAKGSCSIILALMGWGAWSLVWGQVAGEIATTIAMWIVQPYRPRLMWDAELGRSMLLYGLQIIGVELVAVLYSNADYAIVGAVLGTTDLALYRQAFTTANLLIISVCYIAARVLFPSFAKLNHNLPAVRKAYLLSVQYITLVTLPLAAGLCAIAPLFIEVIFTNKWAAMAPALQLLAIRAGIGTVVFNSGSLFKAIGRPNIVTVRLLINFPILIGVVFVSVNYGFVGVAVGQVGMALWAMLIDVCTVRYFIRVPFRQVWSTIQPSLVASIGMGIIVWLFVNNVSSDWQVIKLISALSLGVLAYIGLLWLTNRRLTTDIVRTTVHMLRPERAATAK